MSANIVNWHLFIVVAFFCPAVQASAPLPRIPPGFIIKWNLLNERSSLTQHFQVDDYQVYRLELAFSSTSSNLDAQHEAEFTRLIGDGTIEIDSSGKARPSKRRAATGLVIPIHVQIEKINRAPPVDVIVDTVVDSQGTSRAGPIANELVVPGTTPLNPLTRGAVFRSLYEVALHPGLYRVRLTAAQQSNIPSNIETMFYIARVPNVSPPR